MKIQPDDALLVIDVQNDFLPGGALAVPDGHLVIPAIARLAPLFHTVVVSQDWHPEGHVSFASTHGVAPFGSIPLDHGEQILWPDHCVQNRPGADLAPDIEALGAHLVIRKGARKQLDSYSAFREADRRTPTGLAGYLREIGVRRVVCVGLATDFCVAWSARDAVECGFEAHVPLYACRGIDLDGSLYRAVADMRNAGVVVTG